MFKIKPDLLRRIVNRLLKVALAFKHLFIYRLFLLLAKLNSIFQKNREQKAYKYLILDVSSPGSLGDEAMVIGAVDYLKERGIKEAGILSAHNRIDWQCYSQIKSAGIKIEFFSLNFTAKDDSIYHEFFNIARQYTNFVVPGADVMDGYYSESSPLLKLRLVSLAHASGLKCSVLGFSFNHQPQASCVKAFKKLPSKIKINTRDRISQARFKHHTGKEINLVADLAFLLHPNGTNPNIKQAQLWIEQAQNQGNIIIGINPNKTLAKSLKVNNSSELATIFSNLIKNLIIAQKNLAFVLIPHDYREDKLFSGDDILCQTIKTQLPNEIQHKCWLFNYRLQAAEVKHICQYLDLVITSRMHLAIACLGVATPALGIVYQGKFAGLYNYFELEQMLIEPEAATQEDKLLSLVITGIENRAKTKQQIAAKIAQVLQLAQQNFAELTVP